jgi:DNA-binding Lrp family transcriptional regulator
MIADGPGARARAELCSDPDRLDLVVAKAADCSRTTVLRARCQLEELGVIPERDPGLSDDAWRPRGEDGLTPAQRALLEVEADPQASNQRLAERARCSRWVVRQARHALERAGTIPVVTAAERERRGKLEADEPLDRWTTLPPQPASMARGLCVVGGHDPDLWHRPSWDHAGRTEAISVCRRCPALADCASWSLSLPASEKYAIYGGMSAIERARKRRERKHGAQAAAQAS